jgi:two-component system, chemotaxis family, response regulator PixG
LEFYSRVYLVTELIKKFRLFKEKGFTGSLFVTIDRQVCWTLYFRAGDCLWLTGGENEQERWRRHLELFLPHYDEISAGQIINPQTCYEKLAVLVSVGTIAQKQVILLINSILAEGLFDIIQYLETHDLGIHCQSQQKDSLAAYNLPAIAAFQVIQQIMLTWYSWKQAGLAKISPNSYPAIQNPTLLIETTNSWLYQLVKESVDGTRSLRLIARKNNQDVLSLAKSLLPLVDSGALLIQRFPVFRKFDLPEVQPKDVIASSELNENPNLFSHSSSVNKSGNKELLTLNREQPLIVCIDDSESFCQIIQSIIVGNNYRFLAINEPLRAPAILLKSKPDLIFLDVMMPHFNGYELCAQLRKVSAFKRIPIVFLTSFDGIVDRARAKITGATGFVPKPVKASQILRVVEKCLSKKDIKKITELDDSAIRFPKESKA